MLERFDWINLPGLIVQVVMLGVTTSLMVASAHALSPVSGQLVPHRAVYEMKLDRAATSAGISELSGRMVFEFRGSSCDGYTQSMRLVSKVIDRSGGDSVTDMRTSSWEKADGKSFRFNATTLRNARVTDVASGRAIQGPAARTKVQLTKPKPKTFAVTESVMFPVQHTRALLTAAAAGKKILQANIYDGSEKGLKYFATTAVVGREVAPKDIVYDADASALSQLDAYASWPVAISYFPAGNDAVIQGDGLPEYQMAFRFFANGVTRDLKIDYGNFAINGILSEVTYFKEPACN